jgi:hypothetical protein
MIEAPIVALVMFAITLFGLGFMFGDIVRYLTHDGRKRRALNRATSMWEVHIGSDGPSYEFLEPGLGQSVVITARKVRRAGQHVEVLQRIEVARVRGSKDPEEILTAVDRAQTLVQTMTLTGVA